jgi:hypothetical protein
LEEVAPTVVFEAYKYVFKQLRTSSRNVSISTATILAGTSWITTIATTATVVSCLAAGTIRAAFLSDLFTQY